MKSQTMGLEATTLAAPLPHSAQPLASVEKTMQTHHEYDQGQDCLIGRDPRTLTPAELEAMGRPKISRGDAIRANCIDCAGGSDAEVRRCAMLTCPMWPFRMGTDPYREPRQMSEEQRAAAVLRLARGRATKKGDTQCPT